MPLCEGVPGFREVLDAIFYHLRAGASWRSGCCPGVWVDRQEQLQQKVRGLGQPLRLGGDRRLLVGFEGLPEASEVVICAAMVHPMLRRLRP